MSGVVQRLERRSPREWLAWMFAPGVRGLLLPRWLFLRALGAIYFAAFYSLAFQVKGLIGPQGLLPAGSYLTRVEDALGALRFWYAPTLLWMGNSDHSVMLLCWAGMTAALLVMANVWPRVTLVVCFVCYLSFVAAAQDFSGYQSDGMLLEAGFLALWFAPAGIWPGLGERSLPMRASWLLLIYEWFRIYFESGAGKWLGGDEQWRHLTALRDYYQNGPLPTWVGWYVAHMPNWFHWTTALATLVMELVLVWMVVFGRRARILCFWMVTVWQAGVILTANYTFLNYLVLVLAFLILDDRYLVRFVPARWRGVVAGWLRVQSVEPALIVSGDDAETDDGAPRELLRIWRAVKVSVAAVMMCWLFYATTVPMVRMFWRTMPMAQGMIAALEPFRIANRYGLFESMTRNRYEVEFQGSDDGKTWTAYPFKYKPQDVMRRPGIYAPYQPRLDWNLWFASLSTWRQNEFVINAEAALLLNDREVLGLFAGDPFAQHAPRYVRAVLWQYWFTTPAEKKATGAWWRRELKGTYAPTVTLEGGELGLVAPAEINQPLP